MKAHLFSLGINSVYFTFFRQALLDEAIQFEALSFLESHFQDFELKQAKERADSKAEEFNRTASMTLRQTKIFQLSRNFPAFNENCLPTAKLDGVIR